MRQVVLDTETTGLSAAEGDRVIEIGLIELDGRRLTGQTRHWYLNPGRSSHPDALKVHGLTDEFLADKPRFEQVADDFLAFVDGAELVIHNAAFDVGFIDAELDRIGRGPLSSVAAGVLDTLQMAREIYPGKAASLDALCKRLEVDNSNRAVHGALLDAGLLAEVYLRMTRGQESLVIEAGGEEVAVELGQAVDFSALVLPVIEPTPQELEAHAAVMAGIDEACGGKAVWRDPMA